LGNGAVELIYLLVKLLKPKKVLIPAPTFCEYEIAVNTNGGQVVDLNLSRTENFNLNLDNTIKMLDEVDMVILCNPNNPTGQLIKKENLLTILRESKKRGIFILLDEAFMDFVEGSEEYSLLSELRKWDNLFILYSLTKFFAIPGLRLGAGLANEELVNKLNFIKDPWNVNCFAQLAGIVSLQDKKYIKDSKTFILKEKDFLYNELKKVNNIYPYKPSVNYIFIDVSKTGYSSKQLQQKIAAQGILVRDCSSYKNLGDQFIRVAVKGREQNIKLVEGFKKAMK